MFEAVAIMQTCEIPEFKRALEQQRLLQVEQAHSVKALRVLKAGLKDFIKSADKMDRDFDEKIAASKKDVAYKQELMRLKAANAAAVAQRKAEANEQAAQLQAIISSQPPGITNGVVLPPSSHQFWDSKVFQTGETSVHMQGLVPGSTCASSPPASSSFLSHSHLCAFLTMLLQIPRACALAMALRRGGPVRRSACGVGAILCSALRCPNAPSSSRRAAAAARGSAHTDQCPAALDAA